MEIEKGQLAVADSAQWMARLKSRLATLYGSRAAEVAKAIEQQASQLPASFPSDKGSSPWNERDIVLITYADQLSSEDKSPLATLTQFLREESLDTLINTVHLLPFYPYSSDDGFSVIDYLAVDPDSGDWDDIAEMANHFELMFDLVLNHISQHSEWFQSYLTGEEPYDRFFHEVDPDTDLTAVVRPRSLPLLSPFETNRGLRHVWTTFSDDQIDLNYAEPEVLVRMLGVLLEYARRGARIVRLDAVAFLWKEIGTDCLHLSQTHEVVKLMRDVVAAVAPQVLILTETNVPHEENVSYFGDGDEAHMVYQFSLPPLLLDAFINGDTGPISAWLKDLEPPQPGTTYFNFTASHDGIGVRPLEGLVPPERIARLCDHVREHGGQVSMRRQSDGSDTPYELNISYVDAIAPNGGDIGFHARQFLATQAVMLGLQGIPAVYFHSLVGTQNDLAGVESSGQPRRINRHKYQWNELQAHLLGHNMSLLAEQIYAGYRHLLAIRVQQPAFHPDAPQEFTETANPAILAFSRTSLDLLADDQQRILVAVNVSESDQPLDIPVEKYQRDLISDQPIGDAESFTLAPGQAVWLC